MSTMSLLGCAVGLLILACHGEAVGKWDEMDDDTIYNYIFDDADLDHIILNHRICDVYLRCFYNTGPCTNLANAMKSKITEVLSTLCGKCTDKQKSIWHHSLNLFIPRRPDEWQRLLSIYDPDGTYWPNVKAFMEGPQPTYQD